MKVALRAQHPCEGGTQGLGKPEVSNQEEKSSCTLQGCSLCPGAFVSTRPFTSGHFFGMLKVLLLFKCTNKVF